MQDAQKARSAMVFTGDNSSAVGIGADSPSAGP